MNPKVDEFLLKRTNWQAEISRLREIMLQSGLEEELKWKQPCYALGNKNIVLLGAFKKFFVLSFFKGVLLQDAEKLLVAPGENSQTVKMFKFSNLSEVNELEDTIKAYVQEAIQNEKEGRKVEFTKSKNLNFSEELKAILKKNAELKKAFEALTPGRQRGYNLYFSAAKQTNTRIARIEKYTQRILDGYGFHDCVCGHSKKPPSCDGSHKNV